MVDAVSGKNLNAAEEMVCAFNRPYGDTFEESAITVPASYAVARNACGVAMVEFTSNHLRGPFSWRF